MASYEVPANAGKVKVAVTLGNRFVVWNGKQGKNEFKIPCKDRKQAQEIAKLVNQMRGGGKIVVT